MIHKNKELQKYQTQGEISFASLTIRDKKAFENYTLQFNFLIQLTL